MAKKTGKTSAPPATVNADPIPQRKRRQRETVFVTKTPTELKDLIGEDTPIQVGRKALVAAYQAQRQADLNEELGLN